MTPRRTEPLGLVAAFRVATSPIHPTTGTQ